MFYILDSWILYADGSVEKKQEERYNKALTAYNNLIDNFPNTKHLAEANKLKEKIDKRLNK